MLLVAFFALVSVCSAYYGYYPGYYPSFVCRTDGGSNLFPFQNPNWKIKMNWPCKYRALREQKCGAFTFLVAPGNRWYYPFYQLDTMWVSITNSAGQKWMGRATNKRAVKYLNSEDRASEEFFKKKGGELESDEVFSTSVTSDHGVSITTVDGAATLTFYPWDPLDTYNYPKSYWKFECFDPYMPDVEYPRQMCGGTNFKRVLKDLTVDLGLKERFHPITHYYANFVINNKTAQTLDYCQLAVSNLQQRKCKNSDEQKIKVLSNCAPMLYNTKRTRCLSFYNCHPMDAYNSCLKWGCKDDFETEGIDGDKLCKELSENIFFCPKIAGPGNLSDRAYAAGCYNGFPILGPGDEDTSLYSPLSD